MPIVNGGLVALLLILAAMSQGESLLWFAFPFSAMIAAMIFVQRLPNAVLLILGLTSSALMLLFFGSFLLLIGENEGLWYQHHIVHECGFNLIAGFAMVAVIAEYSCRMKEHVSFDSANEWSNIRQRIQALRPSN